MSQYPQPPQPPYPTPPFSQHAYGPEPLALARRASLVMFILGGLMTLMGACGSVQSLTASSAELQRVLDQQQQAMPPGQSMPFTVDTLRNIAAAIWFSVMLAGVVLIGLGTGVRRGSRGAMTGGVVLGGGLLLIIALFMLMSVIAALMSPAMLAVGCACAVPAIPFGLMIVWLVQAMRATSSAGASTAAAMQQYQAQMWHYQQAYQQQQQQASYPQYPPGGAGGYPAPPPPPQQSGGYGYGYGQQQPPPPNPQQQQPDPQWKDPNGPPPKRDPRRPLHLAVRSARVLGVLFVLLGLCGTSSMLYVGRGGPSVGAMSTVFLIGAVLFYLVPGTCYLLFSTFLANYRPWAVTATLVVTALHFLLVLLAGGGTVMTFFTAPMVTPGMWAMAGIFALVLLALGQMVYHLIKSYESVRHPPFGREVREGFTPVFPATPTAPPPPPGTV